MSCSDDGGGGGEGGGRPSSSDDAAVELLAARPLPEEADITPQLPSPDGAEGGKAAAEGQAVEPGDGPGHTGQQPDIIAGGGAADSDVADRPAVPEQHPRHNPPPPPANAEKEPEATTTTGWREGVGMPPQRLSREHLRRLDELHADDAGGGAGGGGGRHVDETHEDVSDISSDSGLAPDADDDVRRASAGSNYEMGYAVGSNQPANFAHRVSVRTRSFTNYSVNNSEHGGSIHGSTISSRRENVDRLLMGGGGSASIGGSGHGSYSGHDGLAFPGGAQQMGYAAASPPGPQRAGAGGAGMAPAYNYDRAYYRSNDWLRFIPRRSFIDTNSSRSNLSNPTTDTGSNPGAPLQEQYPGGQHAMGNNFPQHPSAVAPAPHGHGHHHSAELQQRRHYNADNPDHYYRGFDNTRIRFVNSRGPTGVPMSRVRRAPDDAASNPELPHGAAAYGHYFNAPDGGGSARGHAYPGVIHAPIDEEEGGYRGGEMYDGGSGHGGAVGGREPASEAGLAGVYPSISRERLDELRAAHNDGDDREAGPAAADGSDNFHSDVGPVAVPETPGGIDEVEGARREMLSPREGGTVSDRGSPDMDGFVEPDPDAGPGSDHPPAPSSEAQHNAAVAFETSVRDVRTSSPPPRECSPAVASLPTLASRDTSVMTASAHNYQSERSRQSSQTPGSRPHSESTRVRSGNAPDGTEGGSAHGSGRHVHGGPAGQSPPVSPADAAAPSEMMQFSSSLRVGGIVRPMDHDGSGRHGSGRGHHRNGSGGTGQQRPSRPSSHSSLPPHVHEERQMHEASWDSKYVTYACRVDQRQEDRSVEIALFSMARPHMRAFHYAWLTFFFAFMAWFAITPLLAEVQSSLNLTKEQIWTSSICSVAGAVVTRCAAGLFCDIYGARWMSAVVLFICGVPTVFTGAVNTSVGLSVLRLITGIGGSAFVTCQYWTTTMFTKEVAGTVSVLLIFRL